MKKIFSVVLCLIAGSLNLATAQKADSFLNFLKSHTKNASLYITKDDREIASLNEDKQMPLAANFQWMITIEFAKQVHNKIIDIQTMVPLAELEKYHLANTDNGDHAKWLAFEKENNQIKGESVSLLEVAKGMMQFGSMANAEYLLDLLGLQNVNGNYKMMSIKDFTPIYYPVSSLFLYQNPQQKKEKTILKAIERFNDHDYGVATTFIHDQLKNNPGYKAMFRTRDLSLRFQKEWSDRLPKSTTKGYTHIAQVMNNRFIFDDDTYNILTQIIEDGDHNIANAKIQGQKTGATPFVFTKTVYTTLDNGEKYAFAYFFNNLNKIEVEQLESWSEDFDQAIMKDEDFLQQVANL